MMIPILFVMIVVWVVCGILAYGMTLYDFETSFPYHSGHLGIASFMGCAGLVGLLVVLVSTHKYGLMFKPYTKEEKWHFYHERYPSLSYESFEDTFD